MQTYLELKVPLRTDTIWMNELKDILNGLPVKWQNGYFHITIAFLDKTPSNVDMASIIDTHLKDMEVPVLTFDKVDAFTASKAGVHIINLTVSDIPEPFNRVVEEIRKDLKLQGGVIESGFKLHVTLGRLGASIMPIAELQALINKLKMPAFSLTLLDLDYREFRGRVIKNWKLNYK